MKDRTFISFDWALKRLLRDKANFGVLEGFVSTLLDKPVKIHRLLESESNKDRDDAKMNRVDLLAEDEQAAYRRYIDDRVILADQIVTARGEGKLEGREEGRKEGREEGLKEGLKEGRAEGRTEVKLEVARAVKANQVAIDQISLYTGLSLEAIDSL